MSDNDSCNSRVVGMDHDTVDGRVYDADYYLHGRATGKSLYEDYRWLPDLTVPMVQAIAEHCGIAPGSRVLDFGCARGYTVKALRSIGYDAYGVDLSRWAIDNADEETRPYVGCCADAPPLLDWEFDWVIAKDVLEHVVQVDQAVDYLMRVAAKGVFVVVPLSWWDGGRYVVEEYEKDVTHIHRLTLDTWVEKFVRPGWNVGFAYRVHGVKDNYAKYVYGNGFLTVRRVER